jgi:steroid delta-isomerase-like uncharacterized protein
MATIAVRNAPASTADLTEQEVQNRQAVLDMVRFFNSHNARGMLSCFDDEMEWLDVPMETPYRGKAEIREFLGVLFEAFPDVLYELKDLVIRGDHAVARFAMHGTHLGALYGVPATGKRTEIPCLSFITLRDGKVLSDHCYFDNTTVLRQWGLMPSLASSLSAPGRAAMWVAVKGRTPVAIGVAAAAVALVIRSRHRRRHR